VKPRLVLSADGFDPEALARALIDERDLPVVPASSLMWSLLEHGAARIATGDTRFALDLMPESEKTRRQALTNRSRIIRAAAAVGVALLATVAVYFQQVAQRQRYLDHLETRAAQLRPVATTLRTKRMQLNVIEDQIDRSQSPLGMMATFAQLAPESGLNVQRISFDRDDRFLVAGSAVETSVFEKLIDDLRAEGSKTFEAFSRAQEVYRTQRTERGQRVWDFGINVPLVEEPAP